MKEVCTCKEKTIANTRRNSGQHPDTRKHDRTVKRIEKYIKEYVKLICKK
jgi:hypothetical protein